MSPQPLSSALFPRAETAAPYMPKVPAVSAWLNRRMSGRSAPAAILRFHRWTYLCSGGRLGHGMFGAPCLVLSTTGRRTGKQRQVALVYVRDGNNYVLAASNDGQDRAPAWLLNIHDHPAVELLVKRHRVAGTARILWPADLGYGRLWAAFNVSSGDRYQHYQANTSRPVPLIIIEPHVQERPAAHRPPSVTRAALAIQVLIGTVSSAGGLYFGLRAGGGWIVSAALFGAAWPLWIASAVGLARRSASARKIAVGLVLALLAFSVFKIAWTHESASYPVAALDLVLLACLLAAPTRKFATR